MTEQFDSWTMEVYNGGAWVDITADVRQKPGPTWNCGIMRNNLLARVGDPGRMVFVLDNSAQNTAGLLG